MPYFNFLTASPIATAILETLRNMQEVPGDDPALTFTESELPFYAPTLSQNLSAWKRLTDVSSAVVAELGFLETLGFAVPRGSDSTEESDNTWLVQADVIELFYGQTETAFFFVEEEGAKPSPRVTQQVTRLFLTRVLPAYRAIAEHLLQGVAGIENSPEVTAITEALRGMEFFARDFGTTQV